MTTGHPISIGHLPIPKNMRLKEHGQHLQFEHRWFKSKYVLSAILAPLFAWFLVNSGFVQGSFSQLTPSVVAIIVAGLTVEYYSLAKILNFTRMSVTHDHIKVATRPVPWTKGISVDRKQVTQFYVAKHRTGDRDYLYSTTYQVNVILTDGKVITLVKGLETVEQGRFIEHKIEHFLGIKDVPVDGEVGKE